MSIIITKGGLYCADFLDAMGKRRRYSLQTKDFTIAQLKYKELIRRRDALKEKIPARIAWDIFKERILIFMKLERNRNTVNRTKLAFRHLESIYEPRFLHDVTPDVLQRVKLYLMEKGVGHANINRIIGSLKTAMHKAEKWELIPKRNWAAVTNIKVPKRRVVFQTPEEIDKILSACPNDMWRLIVLLGADAGLRRIEMMNLRWEDVDFKNNQLYIAPSKTVYYRYVPMTEALKNALQAAKLGATNEFVVNPSKRGTRVEVDYLTVNYRPIAKSVGISSFLHKLRHTFASQLVQNGVELYTVSKLLGHRNIQTTEIYAHLAPETMQKAVTHLPKHNSPTLHIESKTVCAPDKACLQLSTDLSDFVKKE